MCRLCLLSCVLFLVLAPAGAQESREVKRLAEKQKDAIARLERILESIDELAQDLQTRGESEKAAQLRDAIKMIRTRSIPVSRLAQSDRTSRASLGDLETAMNTMASILEQTPERAPEVSEIGLKVVAVLERIVVLLSGENDLAALEERERNLERARDEAHRLSRQQELLKKLTRANAEHTPAEKIAELSAKELEALAKKLDQLDSRSRRDLRGLDKARERASQLNALLRRQQALRTETAVRDGQTDKLRPKINQVLAQLESLQRAAERAASETATQTSLQELKRKVAALSRRQEKLAHEVAQRNALEKAVDALRPGRKMDPDKIKKALAAAAKAAPQAEAAAIRKAAKDLGDDEARKEALKAAQSALKAAASRETLARDEKVLAREVERALAEHQPEEQVAAALKAAQRAAKEASEKLERGQDAANEATAAADALKKAEAMLGKEIESRDSKERREAQAKARDEKAAEAAKLAQALKELAEDAETEKAGIKQAVEDAADATKKAAEDLKNSAEAVKNAADTRAKQKAEAAAERLERAGRELRQALKQRDDMVKRQERVGEDLRGLGEDAQDDKAKDLFKAAANKAQSAAKDLKGGKYGKAGATQDEVLKAIEQLAKGAREAAEKAAQQQRGALDQLGKETQQAAQKAAKIAENLEKGARQARQNDARERLEDAAERTKKAEEALRRSLKRLEDAMPKSADKERQTAKDELERAREAVKDLREPQGRKSNKDALSKLAQKQKDLSDRVKTLKDQLQRNKQKAGVEQLEAAQSAMRQAQQALERNDADEAERAQERAQKALEQSEQEMRQEERRYRRLRQHELLFRLREELKGFRRTTQSNLEDLQKVDAQARRDGRVSRAIYKGDIKPLIASNGELKRNIGDKADAIGKEGAVVYTYLLRGCADDLTEVNGHLSRREVGIIPQEVLGDIVRRFDMALKGLERDLAEKREEQQQQQQQQRNGQGQQGQNQPNGEPRLVPANAEVRMVLVLQRALNEERENFFNNRPEFNKRKPSDGEKLRLERMYHQQGSLAELFDDLRENLLGGENEDDPFEELEKEEGR